MQKPIWQFFTLTKGPKLTVTVYTPPVSPHTYCSFHHHHSSGHPTVMAAPTTEKPLGLSLDFLPLVDMRTLTQSELRALSSCSSPSFDPGRTGEIFIPIDLSSFNETTGSHRQTYSRPSSHHHHHRHRLAGLHPKNPNPPSPRPPASNDPLIDSDRRESRCIVSFLKQLLSSHPEFEQLDLVDFNSFSHLNDAINFTSHKSPVAAGAELAVVDGNYKIGEKKRRRGRKPKVKVLNTEEIEIQREREIGLEIVNINGIVVDLVALASLEDPYKDELSRRTEGMDKDEELLGFFRELGGQWCSRRRKRKIVDASEFGDALPVGWKLLLGIKRKEGRAWVYCRRYISPGGQHFMSCKEVSKYLQSIFGRYDAQHMRDYPRVNTQQIHKMVSECFAGASSNEGDQRQSGEHEKAIALPGIENLELEEVKIHDLFECHKCNMVFDEKDTYLQHLLSFHERTTKRYRIGSSVGDGVIVKDGKYECQFCHKVFDERRRYNSHVGIHVRNYVRGIKESPGDGMALQMRSNSSANDELSANISRMDALIEIAQNSIRETSPGLNIESSGTQNAELLASVSDHVVQSDSSPNGPYIKSGLEQHQQKVDSMIIDEITQNIDDSGIVLNNKRDYSGNGRHGNGAVALGGEECLSLSTVETGKFIIEPKTENDDDCKSEDVDKTRCIEVEVDFGSNDTVADNNIVKETLQQPLREDGLSHGVPQLSMASARPSQTFSATTVSLDEIVSSVMDKKDDRITGFEDLKLEEIEQLKFSFSNEMEMPINLVNNSEIDRIFDTSVQFESDITVEDAGGQQLTTLCIWCGVEFSHECSDTELQSDSVGYMCPTCKERISGPLHGLGGGGP